MEDVFPNSTANETSAVKAFVEDLEGQNTIDVWRSSLCLTIGREINTRQLVL